MGGSSQALVSALPTANCQLQALSGHFARHLTTLPSLTRFLLGMKGLSHCMVGKQSVLSYS